MSIPRALRRAAVAAAAAALSVSSFVVAAPPVAADGEVAVPNASFEEWTAPGSWVAAEWAMTNTVWVSGAAAHSGTYSQALGEWNDDTVLSQTVTAAAGSYDVSVFVWANEGLGTSALTANGVSEPLVSGGATQIDGSLTWDEVVVKNVPVGADGQLEIQIALDAFPSSLYGYIDDVTVTPSAPPADVAVPNASFEEWTAPGSWVAAEWAMTNTVWVSGTAARTGSYSQGLGEWNDATTLSQTVTAPQGVYDVSIFVWANEGLGASALTANGVSEPLVSGGATQIDGSLTWDEVVVKNVPVGADGQLEITIVLDTFPASLYGYLDDVTVVPSAAGPDPESTESFLTEPGFESGGAAWAIGGDLVTPGRGDSATAVQHSGSAAQQTAQTVTGLADGYYRLTAWVQNDGAYDEAYIFASGGGDSDAMTAIPRTNFPYDADGTWKKTTLRGVHVTSGTLTVGLRTSGTGGGSVFLDDLALVKDDGPYEMLIGGDISALTYTEDNGGRYFDTAGVERDPLEILADNGWNIVRIRVYNDPGKGRGSDGYYVPEGYVDAADALDLSRRAKAAGLQIQLSFHYSDYWTNPGIQMVPAGWQSLIEGASDADAVTILENEVHDYTKDLLDQLAAQGTTPEYVAIGNETRSGMLFPYGSTGNWDNLARFYNAGAQAVREAAPDAKVIIHLDDGGNTATYRTYFTNAENRGVDYDIIGTSFYPYWTNKSAPQFAAFATTISQQFDKPIMVMETGFNYQANTGSGDVGQLMHNGPYGDADSSTPELQRDFMIELFNELQGVPGGMAIGDLYWDPIQLYAGGQTGWAYNEATDRAEINAIDNTTLFDLEGHALPVLDAYRLNTRGSQMGIVGGRVLDAIGQPVAGATVTLAGGVGDRTAVTNAYGDYYFPGTEPGEHTVAAQKAGLGASSASTFTVAAGARSTVGLTVTGQQALRAVSGTVTAQGGGALQGALLTLSGPGLTEPRLAGADGSYLFPYVADGEYELTAVQDGYVAASMIVTVAGASVVQHIAMIPDVGSVAGHVYGPNNAPLAGATVSADGHEVTTGADGSFLLSGVPSGSGVTVSAKANGHLATVSEPLVVEHSQTTSGVRLVLPTAVAVTNGGFEAAGSGGEATAEGWIVTSDPAGAAIRQDRTYFGGAYEGQFGGVFWLDSDYTAAMEQSLPAAQPGIYTVRAATYSGVTGRMTMQLRDEAGALLAETVVPRSSVPQITEVTAEVSSPTFTIAFVVEGASGDWAVIDAVVAGYLGDADHTPEVPAPVSLAISPSALALKVGGSSTLRAAISPAEASQAVEWISSDESVVRVSPTGVVTAAGVGSATVRAVSLADPTVSAEVAVTVASASSPTPDSPGTPGTGGGTGSDAGQQTPGGGSGDLASTGSMVGPLLVLALGLVLAGGWALLVRRQRVTD